MLELADEAILAVSAPEEATLLRVGLAEYLAPQHLHPLLARFRRAHPNCDLSLVLGTGPMLHEAMGNEELDVIITGPDAEGGQLLWEEPLVWAGTPANAAEGPETLELVLMHAPCFYRQIAFDALAKEAKSWKLSIDANSIQAVQSAIRAGLGISVMPISAVPPDFVILSDGLPPLPGTSVMSYMSADNAHPYAQRFTDYLLAGIEHSLDNKRDMTFHDQEASVIPFVKEA